MRLNVSVGVVTWPDDGRTKAELLHRLDEIMYLAKSVAWSGEPADEQQGMNSRSPGPEKLKIFTPFRTALIAVLVVGLFAWFIWPTRYRYDHAKFGPMDVPIRIDRLSGRTEALYPYGWTTLGQKPKTDTIPSGAAVGEPAPPTGPINEGSTNGTATTADVAPKKRGRQYSDLPEGAIVVAVPSIKPGNYDYLKNPATTQGEVTIIGPDNKTYVFPPGTTKNDAIRYFKRKGIGTAATSGTPSTQAESSPSKSRRVRDLVGHLLALDPTPCIVSPHALMPCGAQAAQ